MCEKLSENKARTARTTRTSLSVWSQETAWRHIELWHQCLFNVMSKNDICRVYYQEFSITALNCMVKNISLVQPKKLRCGYSCGYKKVNCSTQKIILFVSKVSFIPSIWVKQSQFIYFLPHKVFYKLMNHFLQQTV